MRSDGAISIKLFDSKVGNAQKPINFSLDFTNRDCDATVSQIDEEIIGTDFGIILSIAERFFLFLQYPNW